MKELLLILVAIPAISMQCLTSSDEAAAVDPTSGMALFKGQQLFSLKMMKKMNELSPDKNVFFSPFSIYNSLLLAYFSSANQTEHSLKDFLSIPQDQTKIDMMNAYAVQRVLQEQAAKSSYELLSANKLFLSPKLNVRECMKDLFKNEIDIVNFESDPKAAVETINKWVAEKTKNNIQDLLNEGSVTENTNMVLANAAYFKGMWKSKFQPELTKKQVFYTTRSKSTLIPMMMQKTSFNHGTSEVLGAHILEMPYKGDDVSLFIILPPVLSSGVHHVFDKLTYKNFQDIVTLETLSPRPVEVVLPKFKIESDMELTPILEVMGIGDLFQSTGNLSALTGSDNLHLDSAVHKAKIDLDEEGTTAAAATALFNFRSSRPLEPTRFICNHPFIYFIFDRVTQTVLFAGVFNEPPKDK